MHPQEGMYVSVGCVGVDWRMQREAACQLAVVKWGCKPCYAGRAADWAEQGPGVRPGGVVRALRVEQQDLPPGSGR